MKLGTALAEKSTLELIQRWRSFWKARQVSSLANSPASSHTLESEYSTLFATGDDSAIRKFCKDLVRAAISDDEQDTSKLDQSLCNTKRTYPTGTIFSTGLLPRTTGEVAVLYLCARGDVLHLRAQMCE